MVLSMITYVILRPEHDTPLGYIRSDAPPSLDQMADHLAILAGVSRDDFIDANSGLLLGFAPLH